MRNLELVQAHSLFTFMSRMTDGPGSFLQQSIAEQSYHVMKKKFACVGVLTSSGLQQSVHAQTSTPVHTFAHTQTFSKTSIKAVCFPSQTNHKRKIHYHRSVIISGGGASQELQGTSQSTGVHVPSKNRRQKLARRCAHGECYLLVIVVVILCPVWQCINEQHANTFCPNICDRHIFRLPSKN